MALAHSPARGQAKLFRQNQEPGQIPFTCQSAYLLPPCTQREVLSGEQELRLFPYRPCFEPGDLVMMREMIIVRLRVQAAGQRSKRSEMAARREDLP
jgi:hypothetical protein